jgi:ribosome-associated translation inhibitor RaiA
MSSSKPSVMLWWRYTMNDQDSNASTAVEVTLQGQFGIGARAAAEELVRSVSRFAPEPVLHARVSLARSDDPAVERPVTAQVDLDLNGRPVLARAQAPTARAALSLARERIRAQFRRHAGQLHAHQRGPSAPPAPAHEALDDQSN